MFRNSVKQIVQDIQKKVENELSLEKEITKAFKTSKPSKKYNIYFSKTSD